MGDAATLGCTLHARSQFRTYNKSAHNRFTQCTLLCKFYCTHCVVEHTTMKKLPKAIFLRHHMQNALLCRPNPTAPPGHVLHRNHGTVSFPRLRSEERRVGKGCRGRRVREAAQEK